MGSFEQSVLYRRTYPTLVVGEQVEHVKCKADGSVFMRLEAFLLLLLLLFVLLLRLLVLLPLMCFCWPAFYTVNESLQGEEVKIGRGKDGEKERPEQSLSLSEQNTG